MPSRRKRKKIASPRMSHGVQPVSARRSRHASSWSRSIGKFAGAICLCLISVVALTAGHKGSQRSQINLWSFRAIQLAVDYSLDSILQMPFAEVDEQTK